MLSEAYACHVHSSCALSKATFRLPCLVGLMQLCPVCSAASLAWCAVVQMSAACLLIRPVPLCL